VCVCVVVEASFIIHTQICGGLTERIKKGSFKARLLLMIVN